MAGKGFNSLICENARKDIVDLKHTVFGNSEPGLKTEVKMNTEFRLRMTSFGWAIILSIVLSFIGQTLFLTARINALEKQPVQKVERIYAGPQYAKQIKM